MPRRAQAALSYLQTPIGDIMGAESHVRILRVLTESEHPIPPVELANETQLDLSGVLRALERLSETGIVRSIGVGRGRVIQFNTSHYLAPSLQQLFHVERQRRQDLIDDLQRAVQALDPTPRSAWIEGPHAVGQDTVRDLLRVGVLVNVRDRQVTTEGLVEPLREIERRFGLTVDLVLRTRADLGTLTREQVDALESVLLVYGVPPIHLVDAIHAAPLGGGAEASGLGKPEGEATVDDGADSVAERVKRGPRTHADLDLKSRQSAEGIVRALKRDPRVVERAQRWIEHRLTLASQAERHELREWAHVLTMPPHRIGAFLLDSGERATRLRQTSPFLAVLKAAERAPRLHSAKGTKS